MSNSISQESINLFIRNKNLEGYPQTYGQSFMNYSLSTHQTQTYEEKTMKCDICLRTVLKEQRI